MNNFFKKFSKSIFAKILFGLILLSFAIAGVEMVSFGNKDTVASIGNKNITSAEYIKQFDSLIKRISAKEQRTISRQEAREQGAEQGVLENIVSENVFSQLFDKLKLRVDPSIVRDQVNRIPGFQDPTTGRFSELAYEQLLKENELTPVTFEKSIRDDLRKQLIMLSISSGYRAPKEFSMQTLAFNTERRFVTIIPIPSSLIGAAPKPTESQITAFYAENREKLMQPETRDFTIVIADIENFKSKATADPAVVKQKFEQAKDNLTTPEKRTFVQIVAPDEAKANEASARLKKGEDPNTIATSLGLQKPLSFDKVAKTSVPDKAVAEIVFKAPVGTSGTAKGALAYSAYVVSAITPAKEADFNAASAEITASLKQESANQLLTDATDAFDEAVASGDSIDKAAAKTGLKIVKLSALSKEGVYSTGQPEPLFATAKEALTSAFNLGSGEATELLNGGEGKYIAIRADKITAAAPLPLTEVKADLTNAWIARETSKLLKAKAETIAAEARKNGLEAAAKKAGSKIITNPQPVSRGMGSPQLTGAIFGAKKGEITIAPVGNGGEYAVIKIENIIRDDETKAPERLAKAEEAVRSSVQQDIVALYERAARNRFKVKTYPDRVKIALGDAPIAPTKK